ncbi:hypothetical protein CVT24_010807 [Panaeolus cyanescens]|uniref:F-box domain-containing protein n=1 Tax=Panaeolus cyanescens TaxID=181874 RepID=A0A409VGZ3_9AGAR|nr:hypothetical protein CVT24_010807 [Panaeolus cyanescens]
MSNAILQPVHVDVPHDIILEVTSSLDALNDKKTLASLCLVSSSLRTVAQMALFSRLFFTYVSVMDFRDGNETLADESEASQSSRFLRTIQNYPHLAQYVRHFHFSVNETWLDGTGLFLKRGIISSWSGIMPRLSHLHGLHWEGDTITPWGSLGPVSRSIIKRVLSSDVLTTVVLKGVAFVPPYTITHCPKLRTLDVSLVKGSNEEGVYGVVPIYLETLVVGSISYSTGIGQFVDLLNRPASNISLSRLTSLSIPTEFAEISDISAIISLCSSSLTDLKLKVPKMAEYPCGSLDGASPNVSESCPTLDLSSLLTLTRLEISGVIRVKWSHQWELKEASSPLPWIGLVLKTLPGRYSSSSRYGGSQIRICLDIEDISVAVLEALSWLDIEPSLQQQVNFRETQLKIRLIGKSGALGATSPSDPFQRPSTALERKEALERKSNLGRLRRSVTIQLLETN